MKNKQLTVRKMPGKKSVAENVSLCRSSSSKIMGLMFSRKKHLLFEFDDEMRVSLHMVFVFFPIWAVYLDSRKHVVHIKKLYPFVSMTYPREKARYVLELVAKPAMKIGDILSW